MTTTDVLDTTDPRLLTPGGGEQLHFLGASRMRLKHDSGSDGALARGMARAPLGATARFSPSVWRRDGCNFMLNRGSAPEVQAGRVSRFLPVLSGRCPFQPGLATTHRPLVLHSHARATLG